MEKTGIFTSLNYYEAGTISEKAQGILDSDGAKKHMYLSEMVKIAITDTTDNVEELSEITDIYDIPVVSCKWVTLSAICGRRLPTKAFPPSQIDQRIFSGCVCHIETSSIKDKQSIWAMVTYNGGNICANMNDKTTHIITINTLGEELLQKLKDKPSIKPVTPDWVVDSINQQKCLIESDYHPQLLDPAAVSSVGSKPALSSTSGLSSTYMPTMSHSTPHVFPATTATITSSTAPPVDTNVYTSSASKFPPLPNLPTNEFRSPQVGLHNPPPPPGQLPYGGHMSPYVQHPPYQTGPYNPAIGSYPQRHIRPPYPMPSSSMPNQVSQEQIRQPLQHQQYTTSTPTASDHPMFGGLNLSAGGDFTTGNMLMSGSLMPPHQPSAANINYGRSAISTSNINLPSPRKVKQSAAHHKSVPVMGMTEVPYPSEASMPEETPIIRMTNMAASPMGSNAKPMLGSAVPAARSKSPAASSTVSVIKPTTEFQSEPDLKLPPKFPFAPPSANSSSTPPTSVSVKTPTTTSTCPPAVTTPTTTTSTTTAAVTAASASSTAPSVSDSVPAPVVYYGYDSNENVPKDMCLVGCIFYMGDYLKPDPELCDQWIKTIEQNSGTVDPSYSNRVTHVLVETQASDVCRLALNDHKRVVTAHWLNDVIGSGRMDPPWRAHHLPHPHTSDKLLCDNQVISITGFNREERTMLKVFTKMIGASFTSYLARSNTALICKSLEGEKVRKAKEWGVECVNVRWLSELVLGNLRALKLPIDNKYKVFGRSSNDFTIDPSLASEVMSGWRVPLKIPKDCWRKFTPNNKADQQAENKRKAEEESLGNPSKRSRLQDIQNTTSNMPFGQRPVVLLTGFTKAEKARYTEMVVKLGGMVTSDATKCSHLIAEKIVRTPNFLKAINFCSFITSSEWITDSAKANHFVDERIFTLQNSEAGSMWNILEALERRHINGKPFRNLIFHLTPGVPFSNELPRNFLTDLIVAAGGSVQDSKEKRWSARKILDLNRQPQKTRNSYIVITCRDDVHLCNDLFSNNIDVYSVEFIFAGIMNQMAPYESSAGCLARVSQNYSFELPDP